MNSVTDHGNRGAGLAITGALLQLAWLLVPLHLIRGVVLESMAKDGDLDARFAAAIARGSLEADLVTNLIAVNLLCLAGFILIAIALVSSRYRRPWLYWFLIVYSPITAITTWVGLPFMVFFYIYCLPRRREFRRAQSL